ncbi:MAG: hypothetical protein P8165_10930 [Deltaproteobacteria bacterium]|jgi:hypothetical protein
MAISAKYGKVDIPGIASDEPVFILRAQDRLAKTTLLMYEALVESHGANVIQGLETEIDRFRNWTGKTKLPD